MTRLSAGLVAALIAVQPPAFRTRTDLVALPLTVADAEGRPVLGLGRDAFSLTEDDRPQPIVQFTGDAVPLSLAIALDASTSMKGRRFGTRAGRGLAAPRPRTGGRGVRMRVQRDRPFVIAPWTTDVHTVERSPPRGFARRQYGLIRDRVERVLGALAIPAIIGVRRWSSSPTATIETRATTRWPRTCVDIPARPRSRAGPTARRGSV